MASARRATGISATATTPIRRDFKWNNYISRYHTRHLDLMDLLALYNGRANAPLDDLAKLFGFPGKLGMDGGKVWEAWQAGKSAEIRDYCETDVINTYLVYNRFRRLRGELTCAEEEVPRASSSRRSWPKSVRRTGRSFSPPGAE
jgi:predicted PolB exonuclease-like 3'-5' exonuclease